jgi:hypothetical protein
VALPDALPATRQDAAKAQPTLRADPYIKALTRPLCPVSGPAFRNTLLSVNSGQGFASSDAYLSKLK